MAEVIQLIETAKWHESSSYASLTNAFRDDQLIHETDPEEIVDFVSVSSVFYEDLELYFRDDAQRWLEEKQRGE